MKINAWGSCKRKAKPFLFMAVFVKFYSKTLLKFHVLYRNKATFALQNILAVYFNKFKD